MFFFKRLPSLSEVSSHGARPLASIDSISTWSMRRVPNPSFFRRPKISVNVLVLMTELIFREVQL